MTSDRGEEPSPAVITPIDEEKGLPAIAVKADDLEEIKKAVEDAASISGGLWLSYLFVLSYIAIAATITWAQRAALFLDIVLLWLLRPPIFADLSVDIFGRRHVFARVLRGFGLVLAGIISIVAIWFSVVAATIPGEWQETALAALDRPL